MTDIDARLTKLEAEAGAEVDIDAEIEAELAKLTPEAQAAFVQEFATAHFVDVSPTVGGLFVDDFGHVDSLEGHAARHGGRGILVTERLVGVTHDAD